MPVPANVSQLGSFAGMINHDGQFIRHLCNFDKVISTINSDLLLNHYDCHQEIIAAANASSNGLRAVISNSYVDGSEKAISDASCTLTSREALQPNRDRYSLRRNFIR
ncbi:hypothetical protein TTRE_0000874601 [Trichuris trichiura]|uniref:Uncharacterized protein n=1 Tax=Trichuris trichiura TaxID=36087 RepID=A0A077ZKT8_TRITR|nr:hypothetical protein TTRE_0000874601 [Trichuris trichiura]